MYVICCWCCCCCCSYYYCQHYISPQLLSLSTLPVLCIVLQISFVTRQKRNNRVKEKMYGIVFVCVKSSIEVFDYCSFCCLNLWKKINFWGMFLFLLVLFLLLLLFFFSVVFSCILETINSPFSRIQKRDNESCTTKGKRVNMRK